MPEELSVFDHEARLKKLAELAPQVRNIPAKEIVNTHLHTFFSFNAEDWSPCRVAYEAKKAGLEVCGTVDFDVLDAMEEIFAAGEILDLPTVAALETRVFVRDMADVEVCSPGEPGVVYFMGTGFTSLPVAGTSAAKMLQSMRQNAEKRNREMLERLQPCINKLNLDYDKDVLPLTPSGNATERHMLAAMDNKARELFADKKEVANFWSYTLGITAEEATGLLGNTAKLRNTIRAKLMKKGGPGYVQPDENTFPPVEEVVKMVVDCGALPCWAWLDGTSDGEADPEKLCDYAVKAGCEAFSIVPDRNWNIADPKIKAIKVANFDAVVKAATERNLVITIGTEMNNYGLPFVDNFDAPEMKKHAQVFRDGAFMLYGHTVMQRREGKGMQSGWCRKEFGADKAARNAFYLKVGKEK